jgi:hypothetical protein
LITYFQNALKVAKPFINMKDVELALRDLLLDTKLVTEPSAVLECARHINRSFSIIRIVDPAHEIL